MAETNGIHKGIRRVLILGDNYAGSSILQALSTQPHLEIHVAHPHEPSTPNPAVTYHTHPTSAPLTPLLTTIAPDLLISTASGGSYTAQRAIIDSAISAKTPRFIPAEFTHDSLNPALQARLPPSKERARTIAHLRQRASAGEISWVAIATGTTLDQGLLSGNLGFDIKWQSATLHGTGDEKFPASTSAWIGRAVLAVLERWEEVRGRYLYAAGMLVSANEVLAAFERATGKGFEVGRQDVESCVREAERRLSQGFPDAGMFLMERSVLYDASLDAAGGFEREDARALLGLEGESVDEVVKGVVHEVQHHGGGGGCGCD